MKNIFEKIVKLSDSRIEELEEDSKNDISKHGWFYKWHKTYIKGMEDEVQEWFDEIRENNSVYLEDELWDIFWVYVCLLQSLEKEWYIESVENVFKRCDKKFWERIQYVRDNKYEWAWEEIKKLQKTVREKEHLKKYWKK